MGFYGLVDHALAPTRRVRWRDTGSRPRSARRWCRRPTDQRREQMSTEAKCPFTHTASGVRSNRDWWPNQLNLTMLQPADPLGKDRSEERRVGKEGRERWEAGEERNKSKCTGDTA